MSGQYICGKCSRQMYCCSNEVGLDVGGNLTYSTDRYQCGQCNRTILVIGEKQKPIENPDQKRHPIHVTLNTGPVSESRVDLDDDVPEGQRRDEKPFSLSDYVPEGLSEEIQFTVAEGAEQWEVGKGGIGVAGLPLPTSYPKMPPVKPPREPGMPVKKDGHGG